MRAASALAVASLCFQDPGPRLPPPPGSNDLRLHDTWIARRRADGTYEPLFGRPILRSASVPDALLLAQSGSAKKAGDILILFVDALTLTEFGTGGLSYSRSSDGGKTWSDRRPIVIRGKRTRGACVDPSLVLLPDGEIRMFFFASEVEPPRPGERGPRDPASAEGSHEIHSAISRDGDIFWVEEGVRVAAPRVSDPAVLRASEREWWMFLSRGPETLLARSEDGLSFAIDPAWICRDGGVPGAIADGKGGARLFVTGRGGISEIEIGADGKAGPSRIVLPAPPDATLVADPSPFRLPDGTEILVYKQVRRPDGSPPDSWPGLRRLPEEREKVRKELKERAASRPTDGKGYHLVRAEFTVNEPREVRDETLRSDYPWCRFFELSIGSNQEWRRPQAGELDLPKFSIGHGRRAYGIVEGSEEIFEIEGPEQMGEFLRKGGIRIPSAESLGALLDRCCFAWFAPLEPGDLRARVVAETSGFLVERGKERWRFRTDSESRVLGVDTLR